MFTIYLPLIKNILLYLDSTPGLSKPSYSTSKIVKLRGPYLMIGVANSCSLGVPFAFRDALDTGHWTFRLATYPSAKPLHLESSSTRSDADDALAPDET